MILLLYLNMHKQINLFKIFKNLKKKKIACIIC